MLIQEASNVTDAIVPDKGYWVYVGNGPTTTTDILFDARGTFNSGNFSFPITYTNNGSLSDDGWNLVSNPYPSAIDWDHASWTKTNVSSTFYTWNPDINNYVTYTTGIGGTNGGAKEIPSSQGFYIKATGASPALSATENVKTNAQPVFVKSNSSSSTNSATNISIKVSKNGSLLRDEAIFRFDALAQDAIDEQDSYKMYPANGASVNVSTVTANKDFTINSMNTFDHSFELPVKFVTTTPGLMTLNVSRINNLLATYPAEFVNDYLVLVDEQGVEININAGATVNFICTPLDTVKEFTIRFHNPVVTKVQQVSNEQANKLVTGTDAAGVFVMLNNVSEQSQIRVYNSLGNLVGTENVSAKSGKFYVSSLNKESVAQGVYFLSLDSESASKTGKVVINR